MHTEHLPREQLLKCMAVEAYQDRCIVITSELALAVSHLSVAINKQNALDNLSILKQDIMSLYYFTCICNSVPCLCHLICYK